MKPGGPVAGAVLMSAVSTGLDWLWNEVIPPAHSRLFGLAHGALLFVLLGTLLGRWNGKPVRGALGGLVSGVLASASFYVYVELFGQFMSARGAYTVSLLCAWGTLWALFVAHAADLAGGPRVPRMMARRTGIVALASIPGFAGVIVLWAKRQGGFCYPCSYFAWLLAFLPALNFLRVKCPTPKPPPDPSTSPFRDGS